MELVGEFGGKGSRSVKVGTSTSLAIAESCGRSSGQGRLDTKGVRLQKVRNPLYLHSDLIAVISQDLLSRMHKKKLLIRTVGIQPLDDVGKNRPCGDHGTIGI